MIHLLIIITISVIIIIGVIIIISVIIIIGGIIIIIIIVVIIFIRKCLTGNVIDCIAEEYKYGDNFLMAIYSSKGLSQQHKANS